jgi:hypothetical protein
LLYEHYCSTGFFLQNTQRDAPTKRDNKNKTNSPMKAHQSSLSALTVGDEAMLTSKPRRGIVENKHRSVFLRMAQGQKICSETQISVLSVPIFLNERTPSLAWVRVENVWSSRILGFFRSGIVRLEPSPCLFER